MGTISFIEDKSVYTATTGDYATDVTFGFIPGITNLIVEGVSGAVGSSFSDVSPVGGTQVLPSSAETWEVVSTSASDTGGVTIETLGADYEEQDDTTVTLNGTTPVTLTGTHFRARLAAMLSDANVGVITFRVFGGGAERLTIPVDDGVSKTSLFSVPAGKTAFGKLETLAVKKGGDAIVKVQASVDGGTLFTGAAIAVYQSPQPIPFPVPVVLPQKTDWRLIASSTNSNTSVSTILDFDIVTNPLLDTIPTAVENMR